MIFRWNQRRTWCLLGATAAACAAAVGCAAADDSAPSSIEGDFGDGDFSNGDGDGVNVSGTGGSSSAGDVGFGGAGNSIPDLPPLPEEVEDDTNYRAPVATGRYLWSANPQSGRVALIDVEDSSTEVLPAGLYPTYLAAIGNEDEPSALVLNVGSSDATRFRVTDTGVLRDTAPLHTGGNRWSTADSGAWAVAWSRKERGVDLDPTEGLQEITVLELGDDSMQATRLTVGYRPSQVQISADDERLIVVSEEGITLVDLTDGPALDKWIDLGLDAANRDVSINAAGTFALVRRTDQATVEVIDLVDPDNVSELTFDGPVTDLDLAPSGRAVAVIRSLSQLATFTLEDVIEDPTAIDEVNVAGEVFGSAALTEDGNTAVVYTNALINERVSVVDLRPADFLSYRTVNTQSPVFNVVPSPDGDHAVVIAAEEGLILGDQGTAAEAFSVIALRSARFPRVVGTTAPVADVALGNSYGLVTASGGGVFEAYLVEMPGLSVTKQQLSTEPLAAGMLEDLGIAYAAQAHPEGRVTFFDFEADEARTLTGFELSAEVVDE